MTLRVLPGLFAVCKLPDGQPPPPSGSLPLFWSRTADETTLVCHEKEAPPCCLAREDGWRTLQVLGSLDFSLTGILSSLTAPLAARGVGVFALSTFDTDYLLVKEHCLDQALAALREAGHTVEA